jgi:hypothetical protein
VRQRADRYAAIGIGSATAIGMASSITAAIWSAVFSPDGSLVANAYGNGAQA